MGRAFEQLTPRQRCLDRSVVCDGVDELIGITIPSMIGSFLPKSGPIEIGLSNAKECEYSDGQRELENEEADYNFWSAPLPWDRGKEGGNSHDGGGGGFQGW